MRKKPVLYFIISALAILLLVCEVLIPEVGAATLLNEVCSILLITLLLVMLLIALWNIVKTRKWSNILLIAAVSSVMFAVVCVKSFNTVHDLIAGPEWVTISNCDVEKKSTSRGIFSLSYYLTGVGVNGESYRFRISGDEYGKLSDVNEVFVLCYKSTERIVEIKKGAKW